MNVSPQDIHITVHDDIIIQYNWTASLRRSYTFQNLSEKSANIRFSTIERLHRSYMNFHPVVHDKLAEYLVHSNKQHVSWTIQVSSLAPGQKYEIQFEGIISPFATIESDGFHCCHEFSPATRMLYSANITFPYENFLDHADILINPVLSSGHNHLCSEGSKLLVVPPRMCADNIPGTAKICLGSKTVEPAMAAMVQYYSNKIPTDKQPLKDTCVLIILHVLSDLHSLIKALESVGMTRENTFIVAIPYSAKQHVISALHHRGYSKIWFSKRYGEEFHRNVQQAEQAAFEYSKKTSKRIIILKDGGYASTLVHSLHRSDAGICLGAVEQTRNGIWECERIPNEERLFPVIDVARCWLKNKIEPPYIGDAVTHNIQSLIAKIGISLRERPVLLIGYGTIGSCIAKSLNGYDVKITVFDKNPEAQKQAKRDHFETVDRLEDAIPHKHLIVGCTGQYRLSASEILLADSGTILVNATSKLFEINHEDMKALNKEEVELIESYGSRHTLLNGRKIDLLAEGLPVNFYGQSESVPNNEIQFIPALLFLMALKLADEGDTLPRKIISVPDDIQSDLECIFKRLRE